MVMSPLCFLLLPIHSYTGYYRSLQTITTNRTHKKLKKKPKKTCSPKPKYEEKGCKKTENRSGNTHTIQWRVPGGSDDNLPVMWDTGVWSLGGEDPQKKEMTTHSSHFLPGKSRGQRSLAGSSPWGHKADMIERLTLSLFTLFKPNAISYILWFWLGQVRLWSSTPPHSCPPEKAAL